MVRISAVKNSAYELILTTLTGTHVNRSANRLLDSSTIVDECIRTTTANDVTHVSV